MSRSLLSFLYLILLCCSGSPLFAQGGKPFLKEGDAFRKSNELVKAIEKYDLAISVDPGLIPAYEARAEVNTLLGNALRSAQDRQRIAELDPADADRGAQAASAFLGLDSLEKARRLSENALKVDRKNMAALQTKVRACLGLEDLDCATEAADAALDLKGTTDTYFLHGVVRAATKDHRTAEADLERVLEWNHLYEPAYVELAEVQLKLYQEYTGPTMQMRTLEKAIEKCTVALDLNPQSTDALFTRSKAYAAQKDYAKAIDDVSRCVALGRADRAVYMQRASYYTGFGQHQNALNDLNRILADHPNDIEVLVLRSEAKEANVDLEGALQDLSAAQAAMKEAKTYSSAELEAIETARARIAAQLFEMNRESNPPRLTILEPFTKDSIAQVSTSIDHLKVSGHILDKSVIKSITVNGARAQYAEDEKDPQFFISIPWGAGDREVIVQAMDVYDNFTVQVLRVERTEGVPPNVSITNPLASAGRVITIDADRNSLFVEGKVDDDSPIRLIAIDGIEASYAPDTLDPEFSIKLDVTDKKNFTLHVEDQFGNATDQVYALVRKAAAVAEKPTPVTTPAPTPSTVPVSEKPGATWVIQLENSNYRNFPAIQGGGNAAKIQKAFSNYSVSRTIRKKDLTKAQLDRFFNIELRDLVRTNNVANLLIWYSGHGKTVGGKAYWVPVDASKDDIYSYFNYGSLKAQMQNYSESVDKTVVVSDAAGNDASFYELTR